MTMMDQLTHHDLALIAGNYGGLLHLNMGSVHIVAVYTPEMAREVLQENLHYQALQPATGRVMGLSPRRSRLDGPDGFEENRLTRENWRVGFQSYQKHHL
ncbi:hypothetical protein Dsin_026688 [Dipteronia sinensis]|uniref:Uncharacterized protein n=1 Tax=Dipteronia sinensis TaxID=43782 RepID=A0AAE0DY95_9ROSI|nr:hypothetical protein Dsin_026688 [Dipteronia sinensis]